MKLLALLPLVALMMSACATAPTEIGDAKRVQKAERIADRMDAKQNRR